MAVQVALMAAAKAKVATGMVVGGLGAVDLYWAAQTFAQVDSSGLGAETLVTGGLTTMVTGALIWVFKRMGSGELVHRDPVEASRALAQVLEQAQVSIDQLAKVTEKLDANAARREDRLWEFIRSGNDPGASSV